MFAKKRAIEEQQGDIAMKKLLISAALSGSILFSAQASAVELLTNGDFETLSSLTGWTVTSTVPPIPAPGPGGTWSAAPNSGALSPLSGFSTPINPVGGTTFALADQLSPSTLALTQTFVVPALATSVLLTFDMFFDDYDGSSPAGFASGLMFTGGNQHVRFDILTAAAGAFSTAPADVVSAILAPVPAPAFPAGSNPWLPSPVFDLTSVLMPGGTYQIRFGLIQELDVQLLGVDNVSIMATVGTPPPRIPEPGMLALFGLAVAGIGFAARRRKAA